MLTLAPRSPDLNSVDFFLWGHLKTLIYKVPFINKDQLRQRIITSCDTTRAAPGIFQRI